MRKTQARWRRAIGAGAITGFLLAGSLGGVRAADPVTFKIGITEAPSGKGLNPFQALLTEDYSLMAVTYDLLIEFGPELQPAPGLATSWDVTDGGPPGHTTSAKGWSGRTASRSPLRTRGSPSSTSGTVTIRRTRARRARWKRYGRRRRGGPSADAVRQYIDLDNGIAKSHIKSIETPDANTLVIKTSAPIITLSQMYIPILAKHIWNNITFADASKKALGPDQAIGTGPFHPTSFDPKQAVTLEANKNFWGGAPHIDQLIYSTSATTTHRSTRSSAETSTCSTAPAGLITRLQDQPGITAQHRQERHLRRAGIQQLGSDAPAVQEGRLQGLPEGPHDRIARESWLTKPEVREAITGA